MQYAERRWPEMEALTDKVVVVPLGSIEQHGRHLPLLTDTMLVDVVSRRAEAETEEAALFLPTLWLGASEHHSGFAGTVTVSNRTYSLMVEEILESLVRAGFRRIFLLSGHGGNVWPAQLAVSTVQLRHRELADLVVVTGTWWGVAGPRIVRVPGLEDADITHAGEWETAMVLHLNPALVEMSEARGAVVTFPSAYFSPDFQGAALVEAALPFERRSATGAFGRPETATPAKGEALLDAAVAEVAAFVREFASWPPIAPGG